MYSRGSSNALGPALDFDKDDNHINVITSHNVTLKLLWNYTETKITITNPVFRITSKITSVVFTLLLSFIVWFWGSVLWIDDLWHIYDKRRTLESQRRCRSYLKASSLFCIKMLHKYIHAICLCLSSCLSIMSIICDPNNGGRWCF